MRLLTDGDNIFKINHNSISLVENVKRNHEEADTRMILHAKQNSYERILMASPVRTYLYHVCPCKITLMEGSIPDCCEKCQKDY